MKQTTKLWFVIGFSLILTSALASAEEGKVSAEKKASGAEPMKMESMMGMHSQCMEMHKDAKMCDQQTREKCEEKMSKEECGKMLKPSKTKK